MTHAISRRDARRATALLSATSLFRTLATLVAGAAPAAVNTPPLTVAGLTAVEAALGKKGAYVAAQATHTTALPRNDLQVTIEGEPVPIVFVGGWVAPKHTLDGQSAMLMSDTVLLQEEVNPLMSAALAQGLEFGAVHNPDAGRCRCRTEKGAEANSTQRLESSGS